MSKAFSVEIQGLHEVQAKTEQMVKDLRGSPMAQAMRDATLVVDRQAKIYAPVDTGRLRASITPEVVQTTKILQGIVGSNVIYAPYMELGTRPHWPPLAALEVWARRHGTTAFIVARAISRRGTKARLYLKRAVTESQSKIHDIFERAVRKIVEKR